MFLLSKIVKGLETLNLPKASKVLPPKVTNWPSQTVTNSTYSPFTIDSSTEFVSTRARGRYGSIKIENINSGENWRFGTFQIDVQPDGRR